jgi:hypothetical protein
VSADRLVAAQIGTDDVGPTVRPTLLAAIEPSPSSPENKSQHQPPEALSDASRAKVSFVAAETSEQASIFTSITHLIGKKLPATSLEATGRPKMSGAPREVRVGKAHPDSIVCLLPGMIDARLQTQSAMWRAGWEQISQGTSCQAEMLSLARNFDEMRANGLSLAVISGERIPSPTDIKPGVDILWDQDGAFMQALDIEPLRYRDTELHPRLTLLVRDGEIVAGFSSTKDFESSLRKLIALAKEPEKSPTDSGDTDTKKLENLGEQPAVKEDAQPSSPEERRQAKETAEAARPKDTSRTDTPLEEPAKDQSKPPMQVQPSEKSVECPKEVIPPVQKAVTAFMTPSSLIGKELVASPVFKAIRNNDASWGRNELLANQALRSAVITIVPGPIDWSLVTNSEDYRATWEAIPGTSTYPAEIKVFEENAQLLRKKGLEPVIMTGAEYLFSLSKVAQEHPSLSAISDYRGSVAQSLGIAPFTVWTKDFQPRLTLLVRDGKVEKAFSETSDFRASLTDMISGVPDLPQAAPVELAAIPSPPPPQQIPIIARTFDVTTLHFDHIVQDVPLRRGQTLLFKKEPYYASSYAFLNLIAAGVEKMRSEVGALPRGCKVRFSIHDGHRSFEHLIDPATLPASSGVTPHTFAGLMLRDPSLFGTLERLADQSGRMGLRLATRNIPGRGTTFTFTHPMRGHSATLALGIIGQ